MNYNIQLTIVSVFLLMTLVLVREVIVTSTN